MNSRRMLYYVAYITSLAQPFFLLRYITNSFPGAIAADYVQLIGILSLFTTISFFGYNLNGVRISRRDENIAREIATVNFGFSLILLLPLVASLYVLQSDLLWASPAIVGRVCLLQWWFNGRERYLSYAITLGVYKGFELLVVIAITKWFGLEYFALSLTLPAAIPLVTFFYFIYKKVNRSTIKDFFRSNYSTASTQAVTNLAGPSLIVMVSLFATSREIIEFTLIEKYVAAIAALILPLNHFIYPKLVSDDDHDNSALVHKSMKLLITVSAGFFVVLTLTFPLYFNFMGLDYSSTTLLLAAVFSLRVLTSPLLNLYSNAMLARGRDGSYFKIIIAANSSLVFAVYFVGSVFSVSLIYPVYICAQVFQLALLYKAIKNV